MSEEDQLANWCERRAAAFNLAYIAQELLACARVIRSQQARIKELETQIRDRSEFGVK